MNLMNEKTQQHSKSERMITMAYERKVLIINGVERSFICDEAEDSLADVLRNMGLTGTKIGCGKGQCGACNVILDGKLIRSCTRKMSKVQDGSTVQTIEGIGTAENLHPLQLAWIVYGGVQCGFCTPGFIVSANVQADLMITRDLDFVCSDHNPVVLRVTLK